MKISLRNKSKIRKSVIIFGYFKFFAYFLMLHGMHLLPKRSTFQFCFKNFSISACISGDLCDGSYLQIAATLCNIKHHSIPAPWSCVFVSRLRSPLALPTWYSANPVWHLLLSLGRGPRQASSSFISWVLSAASKLWSPVLKASEVPSMVEWGTEPREVYKQRVLWKVN